MSNKSKTGSKGYALEEILRAYFLRAGFFVVRGIPYMLDGEELTDIDLWLYERSSSTARRCQIVDIKSKSKPKAMERIIWTRGLVEALDMDCAYVATTDNRNVARKIANKLGIKLLDGNDIKRIQESDKVLFEDRITDDELLNDIRKLDKQRCNKDIQLCLMDLKSSALIGLGASSLVRSLEAFQSFVNKAVEAHPNSEPAILFGRLVYLSSAFVAFNLDYIGAEASFQTNEERRNIFMNAVRYGNKDKQEGLRDVRVATGLIRKYLDNGSALATKLEGQINRDYDKVPAEIIADQMVRLEKGQALFNCARTLEYSAYMLECPNFDAMETQAKSFIAALLDYCSVDRNLFASCWNKTVERDATIENNNTEETHDGTGPLFKKP